MTTDPRFAKAASRLALPLKKRSNSSRVVEAVHADIDERGAGLDHLRRDEAGPADGGDENVGLPRNLSEIPGLGVANRHGGVFVQQQDRHGLAHNVAAAHDDGVLTGDGNVAALENLDHARRRAGRERRAAGKQAARIDGMKSVHVFRRIDRIQQTLGVDVRGQRKLDQDAVDLVARVELSDQRVHLFGGDGVGRRDEVAVDPEFGAGLHLAANVNLRCCHVAHQHRGQARLDATWPPAGEPLRPLPA